MAKLNRIYLCKWFMYGVKAVIVSASLKTLEHPKYGKPNNVEFIGMTKGPERIVLLSEEPI
jgi:hypothetical protein